MGEGILRGLVGRTPDAGIDVRSAGTLGIVGAPASDEAVRVARSHGVDISRHASSSANAANVEAADVVLAMTEMHVEELRERFPEAADRIHLLSMYADGSDIDVPDPVGGPVEEYESAYRMIAGYLTSALPKILALARGRSGGTDTG